MRRSRSRVARTRLAALGAAALASVACAERDRLRFDCGGIVVRVSTQQRVPGWAGGEENVYAELTAPGGTPMRAKIDNNGRWLDRLGASVAHDGSWVRFHVRDPRGAAAGRYQFSIVAFVDARDGTLIRTTVTNSTDEERATLFRSSAALAQAQTIRGREVAWRPCS